MNSFSKFKLLVLACGLFLASCGNQQTNMEDVTSYEPGTFGYDLAFMKEHQDILVLKNEQAQILLAPNYQGRVMTSTATGLEGKSFGWLNYALIESGAPVPHFNNYGGEERFWLGPEGGQFSIYFAPGVSFTFENWQVPAPIDSEPFKLISKTPVEAVFSQAISLTNYSNFTFSLDVYRKIELLNTEEIQGFLGTLLPKGLEVVAYTTTNRITNTGEEEWSKHTGLLSIWILGQLISSPTNTVMVPYIEGEESDLGPIVNDTYFGKVEASRLQVKEGIIYFKADGNKRGKIGLSPNRAKNYLGSYDSAEKVLTLMFFNKPEQHSGYVNSLWELQEQPFGGDVVNSYNDGPLDDGTQLGPFYELEASSSAAELKPDQSHEHINTTIHITGEDEGINKLLNKLFGVGADEISKALIQ